MDQPLYDDIVHEIVICRPLEWVYVSKKWRNVAIDTMYTLLDVDGVNLAIRSKYVVICCINNIDKLITIINSYDSFKLYGFVNILIEISNPKFDFMLFSHWQKFDKRVLKVLFKSGVLETHTECKLVQECGLADKTIKKNIGSALWNGLFEQEGNLFNGKEWFDEQAKYVLDYAAKHHPNLIIDYITNSITYPVNWDPDCLEMVISMYSDMVEPMIVECAKKAIVNEREYLLKYYTDC
ncbi:Hypothetical protein FSTVST1_436 [Faustovirus ST1]|nr:Hypothetical protein FSTVST1_436 [Faustovirus ST1]